MYGCKAGLLRQLLGVTKAEELSELFTSSNQAKSICYPIVLSIFPDYTIREYDQHTDYEFFSQLMIDLVIPELELQFRQRELPSGDELILINHHHEYESQQAFLASLENGHLFGKICSTEG